MENELSAEKIWTTIESLHSKNQNRIGNSFYIKLQNGITYIYKALPNGRLLSIDDWFEGYVETLGPQEDGLIYCVKYEKTKFSIYEFLSDKFQNKPSATLKFPKTQIAVLRLLAGEFSIIRVVLDYIYEGKRYWALDCFDVNSYGLSIVYNITDDKIHEKSRYNPKYRHSDSAIIFRFSFAPYKFGIVSDYLPFHYEDSQIFYIVDFYNNTKISLFDCKYRNVHIYEYGNDCYSVYAYKKHSPVAFIKYKGSENELEIFTYYNDLTNPHSKTRKFKIGGMSVSISFIKKESGSKSCIDEMIRTLNIKNSVVPDSKFMYEKIQGNQALIHISSIKDGNLILVKDLVDLLLASKIKNDYVPVDFDLFRMTFLGEACNYFDSLRVYCLFQTTLSRLRSSKYFLCGDSDYLSIELFAQEISFSKICSHKVFSFYNNYWDDGSFKKEPLQVDFCNDCSFELSIRINIDFELPKETVAEDVELLTFDDILNELNDSRYQYKEDQTECHLETPGQKFYRFVLPKALD